jgi:hypothetical protein
LQVAGCRLQVAGCRLQVAGCRLQVAGCRLQVAGDFNCTKEGSELVCVVCSHLTSFCYSVRVFLLTVYCYYYLVLRYGYFVLLTETTVDEVSALLKG